MRAISYCLLLIALAVHAEAVVVVHDNDNGGWWKDGAKAEWSFGVLDEDGDGKVSPAELRKAQEQFLVALKESRATLLAASDLDGTGKLSRSEALSAKPRFGSLMAKAKELAPIAYGSDKDGHLSEAGKKKLAHALGAVFVTYNAKRIDTNKNGAADDAEVIRAIESIMAGKGALFTICDTNNDGQVSPQEAKLAFDLLAVSGGLQPL